ncbi:MAG: transporter [Deltaproteobacteria bacterium]|nr:transporter [Deltaproteobacteria bacterium]
MAAFYWIVLLISDTAGQLLLKMGAVKASASGWTPNHLIFGGYGFYIISFVVWMQILRKVRLFIALAASSLMYITVAFGSYVFMGEIITAHIILGTFLIAAGVFLLGVGRNPADL